MIVCIALNSIAHLDFGGMGYCDFITKNHDSEEVVWFISSNFDIESNIISALSARKYAKYYPIGCLSHHATNDDILKGMHRLGDFLSKNRHKIDKVYLDRICIYAQIPLYNNNLDYTVVGSDGESYSFNFDSFYIQRVLSKGKSLNVRMKEIVTKYDSVFFDKHPYLFDSLWAKSSKFMYFLPPVIFNPNSYQVTNKYNDNSISVTKGNMKLLIALGNTFSMLALERIVQYLNIGQKFFREYDIKVLCGTEAIRDKLAESIDLDVDLMVWGDYGESFAWADVAIGHGGTSFVFHCLNSSTIPLFFPTMAFTYAPILYVCYIIQIAGAL